MRKRAQRKSIPVEVKHIPEPIKPEKKRFKMKKNWWIAVSLIAIFFLVLTLNAYFNISSGFAVNPTGETLSEKFYLSGPDPYYNMRLVEVTTETGEYPFYQTTDPLLNYPLQVTGKRAPLFNMMAIWFSRLLVPFMDEMNAVGYSMQFVPALFGALLVFPVYFIGKELFGRKSGLIAAFLVAVIPIHLGSGHGSAYALFDHDSFNLLLFTLTFLFLIKGVKERDTKRSIIYALLGGVALAALSMTWVEAQFLYVVVAIYAIVQMIMDIFTNKAEPRVTLVPIIILFAGYGLSLPVLISRATFTLSLPFYLCIGVAAFGLLYFFLHRKKIPWIISLPAIFSIAGVVLIFLYFIKSITAYLPFLSALEQISDILRGIGIYGQKVSLTVAEASTSNISRSVMSFGPTVYWLAWAGFVLLLYLYVRQKWRREYLFLIVLFIINIWLAGTAGRFLNDSVPMITILAGWVIWIAIDKVQFKQMIRNIKNAGGGLRGTRRGIKAFHILGFIFVVFIVIMPNALLAFDAAIPSAATKNGTSNMKTDYFGEDYGGAFGSGLYTEVYWVDALSWLNKQDTDIEDPADRPATISWWDYGFYESAVGDHPTVADNFQTGIPPAANFHTSTSEKEGISIWIIRLLEGDLKDNDGEFSSDVIEMLKERVGENETNNITTWMKDPTTCPSYNTPIGEKYRTEESDLLLVGEQYKQNAFYHDITGLLNNTLDDEGITWLYHDIQELTGYSIRYYMVEGYDINIFAIFTFLADKGIHGYLTSEDDFFITWYEDSDGNQYTLEEVQNFTQEEIRDIQEKGGLEPRTEWKDAFYNSMVYRTYLGPIPKDIFEQSPNDGNQLMSSGYYGPTAYMKHFALEYLSPLGYARGAGRVCTNCRAVVIAKYYEGAFINGTVTANNTPLQFVNVEVLDEYNIPHEVVLTDENGNFSVTAPGGNITLRFTYAREVLLDEITFNQTNNTLFSPISDEEAMRLTDYHREINFSFNLSTLEGFVYEDVNDNGSYEPNIDTPLSGITVELTDEYGLFPSPEPVETDENGHYKFADLFSSKYRIRVIEDGFELHNKAVVLNPGYRSYNVSKPKLGGVEGYIYLDKNINLEYDAGEEMANADVDLIYDVNNMLVDSITTDDTGHYNFGSLIPGDYSLFVTLENSTTGYHDYEKLELITIEENTTIMDNISVDLATITVSGNTIHDGENVGGIEIEFMPELSVANNTASVATVTSDENGSYTAELKPGTYNITVDATVDVGIFSYSGTLELTKGEGMKSFDIQLTKESITVSGHVSYEGVNKENITIVFTKIYEPSFETSAISDENGFYTAELIFGEYQTDVHQMVEEGGESINYNFVGSLQMEEGDTAITYNIALGIED